MWAGALDQGCMWRWQGWGRGVAGDSGPGTKVQVLSSPEFPPPPLHPSRHLPPCWSTPDPVTSDTGPSALPGCLARRGTACQGPDDGQISPFVSFSVSHIFSAFPRPSPGLCWASPDPPQGRFTWVLDLCSDSPRQDSCWIYPQVHGELEGWRLQAVLHWSPPACPALHFLPCLRHPQPRTSFLNFGHLSWP